MRRPLFNWTVAIAALVAAVALRWLLEPLMAGSLPLVTLFGAVAGAVLLVAAVLVDANPPKPEQSPNQGTAVNR